jgi:hypothetical protein
VAVVAAVAVAQVQTAAVRVLREQLTQAAEVAVFLQTAVQGLLQFVTLAHNA